MPKVRDPLMLATTCIDIWPHEGSGKLSCIVYTLLSLSCYLGTHVLFDYGRIVGYTLHIYGAYDL